MNTPLRLPSWSKIVDGLMRIGLHQHQIAKEVGVSQPFLSNLLRKHRATLSFETGLRLYTLYARSVLRRELVLVKTSKK